VTDAGTQRMLFVVHPNATEEETAALVAVLMARRATAARSAAARAAVGRDRARSHWHDHSRLLGPLPRPGPGAWRASGRPR
jgi:acyl-CoA carboxylase epsilon subunit